MSRTVLMFGSLLPELEARLERDYEFHRVPDRGEDPEIDAALPRVRAVVTGGGTGLSGTWMERLPALGLIAVNGVGTDKVDLAQARRRGIHVTTTSGALTEDVADFGMALILGVLRRIGEGDRMVRAGRWQAGEELPLGTSLRGKRVGILGLGAIGRALGERVAVFGMEIEFWSRSPKEVPGWLRAETPVGLAAWADVLAVAAAATPETANLVGPEVLSSLGPQGFLVNIARGTLVDEDALLSALSSGGIAGAGLDVFVGEPQIRPEFLGLKNVLLMPHHASATKETRLAMGEIVLAELAKFFEGGSPTTAVV